jgi:hypothetical protein
MNFYPVKKEWIPAIYEDEDLDLQGQVEEIKKLKDGVSGCIYFIEKYYKINLPKASNQDGAEDADAEIRNRLMMYNPYVVGYGIMPCCLLPIQKEYMIPRVLQNRYTVLDKPRQMGMSVVTGAICLWEMLFFPGSAIEIVSKDNPAAKGYVKKVRQGYRYLPDWMKTWIPIKKGTDNVKSFALDNGSTISASAPTDGAGRGDSLTRIIMDEAAWGGLKDNAENIFAAAEPTLANTNGCATVISTQNGIGTWYNTLTVEAAAEDGNSDWVYVDLPWHSFPGRDYKWIASKLKKFGRRKVAQEYLKDALGSGTTVLPTETIEYYQSRIRNPIRTESGDRVRIFEEVDPMAPYIMASDIAQGAGADFSTFVIMNFETRKIVCTFKGKISTRRFSLLMKKYAIMYNNCMIAPEITGCGDACREDFMSNDPAYNYSNLFYHMSATGKASLPGWKTTAATRPLLVASLETHIGELKDVDIPDSRIISEMTTFVWTEKGRPDHEKGYHDDLLFALMICIKAADISPVINVNALRDPVFLEKMKQDIRDKIEAQREKAKNSYLDITEAPTANYFNDNKDNDSFSIDLLSGR